MRRLYNIVIILLVIDIVGVGALWFAYATMETKKAEEAELQKKLTEETQKSLQLTALRRVVEQAQKESAVLDEYFYDTSEESQIKFVSDMEALGVPAGTKAEIKSFTFVDGTAPLFRGTLTFSGEWKNVYHLLRLIETFPARLVITNFAVSGSQEKEGVALTWSGSASIELRSVKNK